MPVLPPSTPFVQSIGSSYTIGNCVQNLPFKFGNRQNFGFMVPGTANYTNQNLADNSLAVIAVMEAIKELTETYEFEELKYQTPVPPAQTLNLSQSNPIVPIGILLGSIAGNANYPQYQNQNFVDVTDIYTFWMWFSGGVNQAGRTLKYRRITTVDNESYGVTSMTQGAVGVAPPVYYSRFGNILQVGPVPDQSYNYFVRVKLRHPFPVGGTATFVPAVLTPTIAGGAVTGITVVQGGTGYPVSAGNVPLVFSPSPSGAVASATANTNTSGIITSVNLSSGGNNYSSAPTCNTAAIQAQQVFAPDSWQEIFEYAACSRLALWEGASEYIAMFDNELAKKIKGTGVMTTAERIAQMQRDERHNERQISLRTAAYTYAR
jgi:hypothetical protein